MSGSRGSSTVEFVLLVPVLVLLLVFATAFGRGVDMSMSLRRAAEDGARAASMVGSRHMERVGRERVLEELSHRDGCLHPRARVEVQQLGVTVFVTVSATCEMDRQGVVSLIPFGRTFTSTSTEVVDVFTYR